MIFKIKVSIAEDRHDTTPRNHYIGVNKITTNYYNTGGVTRNQSLSLDCWLLLLLFLLLLLLGIDPIQVRIPVI